MRTKSRLRFLGWLCVVAVLLTVVSLPAAGLPQAILPQAGPALCKPSPFSLLRGAEETPPPNLLVLPGVAARAPPLA